MPENKSLIQRFVSALGFKSERPDYGQGPNYGSDQYSPSWRFTGWGRNFQGRSWGTDINYSQEVGPLDDSSLVMAVCNDSGIQLAEAKPSVRRPDSKGVMQPEPGHPIAQPLDLWPRF